MMRYVLAQAGVLLLLSIAAVLQGTTIIRDYSTTYGANLAGWYLIALGAVLGVITLIYFFRNGRQPEEVFAAPTAEEQLQRKKLGWLLLLLVGYVLVIDYLGYIVSTVLFFMIYLRFLGGYGWGRVLWISIVFGVSFGLIFSYVGMSLPTGFIPFP